MSNISLNFKQKHKNSQYIIDEFNKPLFQNKFYINKSGLIYNSNILRTFKELWKQNPQRFALDYYDDFEFYRIILLVNDIPSVFKFDIFFLKNKQLIAPKKNVIYQMFNI